MDITPENIPDDLSLCQQMLLELLAAYNKEKSLTSKLQHQLEQLLRHRYGQRADRIDLDNPGLFTREMLEAALLEKAKEEAKQEKETVSYKRRKPRRGHGRNEIPDDLPRERIECPLPEGEKRCSTCGTDKVKIREKVTKQLEYVPASLKVKEFVQPVLACPQECPGQMVTARKPVQPIEKSIAGPGLLAQICVSKHGDHLPLNRQEDILGRHGVHLARSTQCDLTRGCADLVRPLVDLAKERVLSSKVVQTDDTPIQVQDRNRKKTKTGRMWGYLDPIEKIAVFDYTPSRSRDGPKQFLTGYTGYLVADAYGGYDRIYATEDVTEVACWAHTRRYFVNAQSSKPDLAFAAIAWIKKLYAVEKEARDEIASLDLGAEEARDRLFERRHALRQEKSVDLLAGFGEWLEKQQTQVVPKSPMMDAIQYTLNQWEALNRYTEDGALPLDNNFAELAMRHIAVGRKNWLFAGSDRGGETAAILTSLIYTAKLHDLDLWAYMNDVLTRIPTMRLSCLDELLPHRWKVLQANEEPAAATAG